MISSSSSSNVAKRHKAERACLAASSAPKAVLARILLTLHAQGCLVEGIVSDDDDESKLRKDIAKAAQDIGAESTPFGPIVQTMTFEGKRPFHWKFIHPLALLFKLSQIAPGFAQLMMRCIESASSGLLSIVIFVDEIRPGNVLRPDLGRATQNLFWAFAEWPEWYIKRDDAWFTFGGIRSKKLQQLGICMSSLMTRVLHVFWHPDGANFLTSGAVLVVGTTNRIVKARFAGFLGDEKGLKEVFGSKGPGSSRCCLSCKNIVQFMDDTLEPDGYLVSVKSHDRSRFDAATDSDVFEMADHLRASHNHISKTAFEDLEQALGLHFIPSGVLYDQHCRSLVRPVKGWFRDWMHVMTVQGVANVELEQVIHVLRANDVKPEAITAFAAHFNLPKAGGKVCEDWFTTARIGKPSEQKDGWKGFSSEVLTIVPIVLCFLQTAVAPTGLLSDHIRCFHLLDRLLKLFSLGAEEGYKQIGLIERLIDEHATAFAELYGDVIKPKYHHLFHIVDHARNLKRLLSCFVTERKHRAVKAIANHLFGNFETALTTDMLILTVERYSNRPHMFCPESLYRPKPIVGEIARVLLQGAGIDAVSTSLRADLLCGQVSKGDLVVMSDRSVGSIVMFAAAGEAVEATIVCVVKPFLRIDDYRHREADLQPIVVNSADILQPLVWYRDGTEVCVLPPKQSAMW